MYRPPTPGPSDGTGADFPLTVHIDGIEVAASGEVTAFEPPWLVGYRLFIGSRDARAAGHLHG